MPLIMYTYLYIDVFANNSHSKARFHVTVITQIKKSVVYFTVRCNEKFDVPNAKTRIFVFRDFMPI